MMDTNFTLPHAIDKKMVASILLFFLSLSVLIRVLLLSSFTILVLFVFSLFLDAITELSQHIAQVYTSSDALTRLVIFVLAVLFCKKVAPVVLRIFKGL